MIGIVYREVIGAYLEKLIKDLKFRREIAKQNKISFQSKRKGT